MKTEAYLFGGVAVFFLGTTLGYALTSGPEPAGTAALAVAFLMSSLVCFFFAQNYRRRGLRPEDDRQGEVLDRRGPVDFFPRTARTRWSRGWAPPSAHWGSSTDCGSS